MKRSQEMTLAQFPEAVQPGLDVRTRLAENRRQAGAAATKRNESDLATAVLIKHVVAGMMARAIEGENGEMYKQIGFAPRMSGTVV